MQSNHPIGVFQLARSFTTDNVILSDPLMLLVPPYKQYLNSYAIATAPFENSLAKTLSGRVAYINYTNIAVSAEFFNASLLIVNNKSVNASDFKPIRRADDSIWGYGAQLLLDEGAQIIKHQNPNAVLSVTLYGFSNQQSWGCTGGMGLAPIASKDIAMYNYVVVYVGTYLHIFCNCTYMSVEKCKFALVDIYASTFVHFYFLILIPMQS